jgi:hypothetical protein
MGRDDDNPFGSIGSARPPLKPLTPVQRRRLESAAAIADDPPEGITFQHTVLCQTSLPYRDPGDSTRVWERRQGAVSLALEAGRVYDRAAQHLVEVGLPYGSRPRLILAHLNREALLHNSPRIEVESSLTAFIKRVLDHHSVNTREIGRFRHQLTRFAASLVRMAVDLPDDRAYQVDTKIIDFMELWGGKDERQRVFWPAVVELSPRYYDSLTKHAVPLDERAIGALANSPVALDVYAWLAQRLHRVDPHRPQFITWVSLHLQFGQGFARLRDFRRAFLDVLDTVHAQYRAARVEADERGITLRCSPPPVKGRLAIAPPPTATVEHTQKPTVESAADARRRAAKRSAPRPAAMPPAVRKHAKEIVARLLQAFIELDAEADRLEVTSPDGNPVFVVEGSGSIYAHTAETKAALQQVLNGLLRVPRDGSLGIDPACTPTPEIEAALQQVRDDLLRADDDD